MNITDQQELHAVEDEQAERPLEEPKGSFVLTCPAHGSLSETQTRRGRDGDWDPRGRASWVSTLPGTDVVRGVPVIRCAFTTITIAVRAGCGALRVSPSEFV